MAARILANCKIYTFNPVQPIATKLLIRDGRIVWLGGAAEHPAGISNEIAVDDLGGQVVMPSFTDAHIHLLAYGRNLQRVNCESPTRDACLQAVARKAAAALPGDWILGHGWDHNLWPDGIGSVTDLDHITHGHLVYLTHKSLHAAWANSDALKRAGISSATADPQGGRIQRDSRGEPDGILLESAMRLVEDILPEPGLADDCTALAAAQQQLWQMGITAAHDFDGWDCLQALQAMQQEGQLGLRVVKGIPLSSMDEAVRLKLYSGFRDGLLMIGWLKLFADGALGPQTAAMLSPYEGSDSVGMLMRDSQDIYEIGSVALAHGISMAAHAIGDRAVRECLNAYAKLGEKYPLESLPLPHRIEHVQLVNPQDMPRFRPLGVAASMQPIHAVSDRDMADRYWGDRCIHAYAWRSLYHAGAKLVFGSDAPVESPNPLLGLHAALTRRRQGDPLEQPGRTTGQCLDITQALAAYIRNPHEIAGMYQKTGRLAPGFNADLVVLPSDPFHINPDSLPSMQPTATMLGGKWVWKRDG